MSEINNEYEEWRRKKQEEQMEMAKHRREGVEKFKMKSGSEYVHETVSSDDEEYQRQVDEEMKLNEGLGDEPEVPHEMTAQEKWHAEMQAAQVEMAKHRREGVEKFKLKSNK